MLDILKSFHLDQLYEPPYYYYALTFIVFFLYFIYRKFFGKFVYRQTTPIRFAERSKTKFVPAFPFGWYRMCDTDELKVGQVIYKKCLGENLVIFRGHDRKAYVLDAYCQHMGSNLGIGGRVKNTNCVECPFHGWIYDGETGNCLGNNGKEAKVCDVYEYHNIEELKEKEDGTYFKKVGEEAVKVRKWVVNETHHQVFIWYHPEEEHRTKPLYELLDLKDYAHLEYRGFGLNTIKNHIQEILENTAQYLHFHYVQGQLINDADLFRFKWFMRWKPAEDPKFVESMKVDDPYQDAYRKSIIDRFINDKNRQYVSLNGLENHLNIPWLKFSRYFFTGTALHLGPGVVYYFFRSWFYDVVFSITALPVEKYEQNFVVTVFANRKMPYFMSALVIYFEIGRISNDGVIWNNKMNPAKIYYNQFGPYDKMFAEWRNFYAKFYKGAYEKEKRQAERGSNKLDW